MLRFFLGTFFVAVSAHAALTGEALRQSACERIKAPGYKGPANDELPYLCQLPEKVKKNIADLYWMTTEDYQAWLQAHPTQPTAPANFGNSLVHAHHLVNALVMDPHSCHFYSTISPSVQSNGPGLKVPRTLIISDFDDLLTQCQLMGAQMKKDKAPVCSSVEFAGHSTQAVGLDSVFGIEENKGKLGHIPSKRRIEQLGNCLRGISAKKAPVVFSTCGGDVHPSTGKMHYWPGKVPAQKELAALLKMPVISGVGAVDGTDEGGATCNQGWHIANHR